MYKDEGTLLIANDDVGILLVQNLSRDDLCADAGIVVDEMRNEVSLAFGGTDKLEPIENGGTIGIGIAVRAVGPEAFAGDDIFETVAVHINQVDGMQLTKGHAVTICCRALVQDGMLAEA